MAVSERPGYGAPKSCYDVISDLDAAMCDSLPQGTSYFMLGGIASGALRAETTIIDENEKRIVASSDSSIPTLRENGTGRDIDILVGDILSPERAGVVKRSVEEAVSNTLRVSVFGFDRHEKVAARGVTMSTMVDWLSQRTVDQSGTYRYVMYPLQQVVHEESYVPWRLQLPSGGEVSVLHPIGHMLAYKMRSVSGLRTKDVEKHEAMERKLLRYPDLVEEMNDGVFREWLQFANAAAALRKDRLSQPETPHPEISRAAQAAFRMKGHLLHWFESKEPVVDFFQKPALQSMLSPFIRDH